MSERNIKQAISPSDLPSMSSGDIPQIKTRTWTFQIPKSCQVGDKDPSTVTLRELTVDQQMDASKLANGDRMRIANELAKTALFAVDGVKVNHGDFGSDIYWQRWSAKVRSLVLQGYAKTHHTEEDEDKSFLDSMQPG